MIHLRENKIITPFSDLIIPKPKFFMPWRAMMAAAGAGAAQASYFFDEDNSEYLAIPGHSSLALGADEFTVECWFRITSGSTVDDKLLIGQGTTGGVDNTEWCLFLNSDRVEFRTQGGGISIQWSSAVSTATWYHVMVTRDSSDVIRLFVDGDEKASTTSSNDFSATTNVQVGYNANDSKTPFDGNIDEIRVLKSAAAQTGNFTPPTEDYTSDANTSLLIHCNEAVSGEDFTDSGNIGHTITETNGANQDTTTYKY